MSATVTRLLCLECKQALPLTAEFFVGEPMAMCWDCWTVAFWPPKLPWWRVSAW